jgi:hypothetical protein
MNWRSAPEARLLRAWDESRGNAAEAVDYLLDVDWCKECHVDHAMSAPRSISPTCFPFLSLWSGKRKSLFVMRQSRVRSSSGRPPSRNRISNSLRLRLSSGRNADRPAKRLRRLFTCLMFAPLRLGSGSRSLRSTRCAAMELVPASFAQLAAPCATILPTWLHSRRAGVSHGRATKFLRSLTRPAC